MNHRAIALLLLLAACTRPVSPDAAKFPPPDERPALFHRLRNAGALDAQRQLVHLSHVCDVAIGDKRFLVIDAMELVRGATTPRSVNQIILLDAKGVPVQSIEYTIERPLYCHGDRLYLLGSLAVGGIQPEGNVLTFTDDGRHVEVGVADINALPGAAFLPDSSD